ncbi:MAG: tRNA (guanosine(37)-N1)-methyltransferase TrmD [Coriobacteriales bacterium]|nr:tRNA (guanosine(37)-N1)-methyltransferase TrmD [Coriobacteriales bacterium]
MRIDVVSVFPEVFEPYMGASILGRARTSGLLEFYAYDLREWTHDKHRTTDDEPYGGGQGQLMKVEPVFEALDYLLAINREGCKLANANTSDTSDTSDTANTSNTSDTANTSSTSDSSSIYNTSDISSALSEKESSNKKGTEVLFFAPHGKPFNQRIAEELASEQDIIMVCGRYEGMDERVYSRATRIISVGDYVLTGGELAAMVVADAIVRLIPGVLGDEMSNVDESFSTEGLLEYPQYTRPANYRGMNVPEVLLSGNHAAIAKWRREMSIIRTAQLRPDLLDGANLTQAERDLANRQGAKLRESSIQTSC